jgi:aspartyl-tRNA(Asn)/glutamyl-tRNA(Gln) amidotransferase subunit B
MAHPGTLPALNKEAVHKVLLVGAALGSQLADFTEFDRKNYFYPDIPKGYQISQYKYPLVSGGRLNGVEITRVHLEEDTARSSHDKGDKSLVDYNRAGVPLMELVTEPVIHDAKTASDFARELQLLLRYLGAGDANMEKGELRVEANISVAPVLDKSDLSSKSDLSKLGTKVEVKNLNSFRSVERAIAYELKRQIELIERGEKVMQETRGWDENKQSTFSQRKKESSHDYRYFPDPDLPKLIISEVPEFSAENLKKELPELPWAKRDRLTIFGFENGTAEVLVGDTHLGEFLDAATKGKEKDFVFRAANYLTSDLAGLAGTDGGVGKLTPESFQKLIDMSFDGSLSSRGIKDVLAVLFKEGGDPEVIAKEKGLTQQSDIGALDSVAQKIIADYPQVVADYKAGKEAALQFLVGQGMKETKGSANPEVLREVLLKNIK